MSLPPPPGLLQELVAGEYSTLLQRQRIEEPELGRRKLDALSVEVRLHAPRVDRQLLDLDRLTALRLLWAQDSPGGGSHARHELLHREGLDEVVVRAELERVHPIVLGSSRTVDDDRRADALATGGLDHPPAVLYGQHQVEDADVERLVAKACEGDVPARDRHGIEAGRREVLGHALRED